MKHHANATFEVKSWDEKPFHEIEGGGKLTEARVTKSFQGDIEGESTLIYLMVYSIDGSASFVGAERVVGRLAGRSGSFVLQHGGTYEGGVAHTKWSVVKGSGTGELKGLSGEGGFSSGHHTSYPITLDYDLA